MNETGIRNLEFRISDSESGIQIADESHKQSHKIPK